MNIRLISRYIRNLNGYFSGEYTPQSYVNNDIELATICSKDINTIPDLITNIFNFYNIPRDQWITI